MDNILHIFDIITLAEKFSEQGEDERKFAYSGSLAKVVYWLHKNKLLDIEAVHKFTREKEQNNDK